MNENSVERAYQILNLMNEDVMSTSSVVDLSFLSCTHGTSTNIADNGKEMDFLALYFYSGIDMIFNTAFS